MIENYPKLHNLGHRETHGMLDFPMQVEEKIDGSQFSFGITTDGVVWCRSKSVAIDMDKPCDFALAVQSVERMAADGELGDGWVYRAEYLRKPRHNVLVYDRVPKGNLVLFDAENQKGEYVAAQQRANIADRLGIDVVPVLDTGTFTAVQLAQFFNQTSILGGCKVEGIVLKAANGLLFDKDRMQAKYVSPAFREVAKQKVVRGPVDDPFAPIARKYGTPARWLKAVQHLTDAGQLVNAPADIPKVLKEVQRDVFEEEGDAIVADVLALAKPKLYRSIVVGLGDWYLRHINPAQEQEQTAA